MSTDGKIPDAQSGVLHSISRQADSKPACAGCNDTRQCQTCGGTGLWYAGTVEEDECSSCGGSGRCPDCPA